MSPEAKSGAAALIYALGLGSFALLGSAVTTHPETRWLYFWAIFAFLILVVGLRLAIALYYAGYRRGERSLNETYEEGSQ